MIHEILRVGQLSCNCSIFGDEASGEAIVITHAHIDHVAGAAKLKAETGAPVYMNERDTMLLDMLDVQANWLGMETPERTEIDTPIKDGSVIQLRSAEFNVLETPGHTQGSVCLWIPSENKLIAGDTLFFDSVGRTDLPGGDARQLIASINNRLLDLPPDAVVVPGHGRTTTIGREKQNNPFLR